MENKTSPWDTQFGGEFLKFLKDPADLKPLQTIYGYFAQDAKAEAAVTKTLLADSRFKALFENWYEPKSILLDELIQLPPGTLGHAYAKYMKDNGLKPDFIDRFKTRSALSYLWLRAAHVHDISHVITGFDTSFQGELALKGFELGQYGSPATAVVLSGGFLSLAASNPETIQLYFERIVDGYHLGKKTPLLAGIKWDQEWTTPLTELKRKLEINNL